MRLQSKKLVDTEASTEHIAHDVVVLARGGKGYAAIPAGVTFEDVPIEREAFEVTFECHNCHHGWTETVTKVEKASNQHPTPPKSPNGVPHHRTSA